MIKNYTSGSTNHIEKIQKILAVNKAKRLMFDFDDIGRVASIMFSMDIDGKEVGFRLPARVKNVESIFLANKKKKSRRYVSELTDAEKEQSYRTAWANIKDWLDAQMALIQTEQVKFEEVFLPYAVQRDGRSYFEHAKEDQFLLGGKTND